MGKMRDQGWWTFDRKPRTEGFWQLRGEIAAFEERVRAICAQPADEYPAITGRWD